MGDEADFAGSFDSLCDKSAPGETVSDDDMWQAIVAAAHASKYGVDEDAPKSPSAVYWDDAPAPAAALNPAPNSPLALDAGEAAFLADIRTIAIRIEAVGSRVTCNPPPVDTNADYLVLIGTWTALVAVVGRHSAIQGGSNANRKGPFRSTKGDFESFRLGQVNVIPATSTDFYDKFMAASDIAKRFNLLNKVDRVVLFDAVMFGMRCSS
jgi:hypothetical protein